MSSIPDLAAAVRCEDNRDLYVSMVELEAESTFAFQGNRWLADVAPEWLPDDLRERIVIAKQNALKRQALEATIPEHLLYTDGWPTALPTAAEARLIADVRESVSALLKLNSRYLTAGEVMERYRTLLHNSAATCEPESNDFALEIA